MSETPPIANKRKLVIAHLCGGLGNQLFIFSAAWALARQNNGELRLDTSAFWRDFKFRRKFALSHFRGAQHLRLQHGRILDLTARIYTKLIGRFAFLPPKLGSLLCEGPTHQMDFDDLWKRASLNESSVLHVFGYRQSEDYFKDHAVELREQLALAFEPSPALAEFSQTIRTMQTVSVSFRRQFGVTLKRAADETDTLGAEYYHKAISAIREQSADPVFLCFGDNLDGIEALLPADVRRIVPPETADQPSEIRDLWLMLQCRHFITCNSTFSWWAAWLGQRPGSVVICPEMRGLTYRVTPSSGWHVVKWR